MIILSVIAVIILIVMTDELGRCEASLQDMTTASQVLSCLVIFGAVHM